MTTAEQVPAQRAGDVLPIRDVTARMREIGAELPPRDGVAVFNRVYLSVTEELERRLAAGLFEEREATGELGARFAARYLDAVDAERAGRRPPACWRPLFQMRRHPAVHALQFALAGINAHIGHDLPLSLVDTCRSRGTEPDALEADYERIGELLTGLEERIREDLMPGPDLLDVADPLTHLVGSWSLERARGGAWAAFRALWGLRAFEALAEEMTEGLDATVGMTGRYLLTPLDR
ncbi:DUF5995 family protein [Streptomyces boncukensis]|uniref:Uncharacterized protein n=1 Tax=Streptomyces boncukensis TaxID=2711219 RepID=A0A6G4WQT5_9ACTN|nr:DUF5995 family protein [Streptomyces boncukensis]NGO66987.1 hypothetical protein [Streptomyces boncukensis]